MSNGNKPITGTFNATGDGVTITGTLTGTVTLEGSGPVPPEPEPPQPPAGGGTPPVSNGVEAGAGNASVSYPWLNSFVGYGVIYVDDRNADQRNYKRTLNSGFNGVLSICPGQWPPGYRISNGTTKGGVYPASGTTAKGTEPIRLCPPPSGTGRLSFFTFAKIVVINPDTSRKGSFTTGLGVVYVNGPNRPMFPYLGAAHDLEVRDMWPETIGPGDTRSVSMFRTDFIDNTLDGGAQNFPNWPNWEMLVSTQTNTEARNMYPAVGISFMNRGPTTLQVGQIYAYGWVS